MKRKSWNKLNCKSAKTITNTLISSVIQFRIRITTNCFFFLFFSFLLFFFHSFVCFSSSGLEQFLKPSHNYSFWTSYRPNHLRPRIGITVATPCFNTNLTKMYFSIKSSSFKNDLIQTIKWCPLNVENYSIVIIFFRTL